MQHVLTTYYNFIGELVIYVVFYGATLEVFNKVMRTQCWLCQLGIVYIVANKIYNSQFTSFKIWFKCF